MSHNGWNSLGDIRELEKLVRRQELQQWGQLTLKLVSDIKYLNGCVKRGRGENFDDQLPAKNVFLYILELEAKVAAMIDGIDKATQWAEQLDCFCQTSITTGQHYQTCAKCMILKILSAYREVK